MQHVSLPWTSPMTLLEVGVDLLIQRCKSSFSVCIPGQDLGEGVNDVLLDQVSCVRRGDGSCIIQRFVKLEHSVRCVAEERVALGKRLPGRNCWPALLDFQSLCLGGRKEFDELPSRLLVF